MLSGYKYIFSKVYTTFMGSKFNYLQTPKRSCRTCNYEWILRDRLGVALVKQEYVVKNLKIDGASAPNCVLDIAIPSEKIAIRLMGAIHQASKKRGIKDWYQKEALGQAKWAVYDFYADKFPNLWNPKRSHEIDMASKEEVLKALGLWDDPSEARASKV